MDPIESMLRSINPVPPEHGDAANSVLAPRLEHSTGQPDGDAAGHSSRRPGHRLAPRARALALAVAAVVLIAAAGLVGVLAQGFLKPPPAGPVPAPSSTQAPTTAAPTPSATAPATDPATGIECTFANVTVADQAGQMLANMKAFPGDFRVLGCAGGWLAFALTGGGYERLLGQGAGNGSGDGNGARGDFYFAQFDGTSYLYNKYTYAQGWSSLQVAGGTPADKAAAMDSRLQQDLGLDPALRPALLGNPPPDPSGPPPTETEAPADPATGVPCSMASVRAGDNPDAWVMQDINAHPDNYTVLACSGGWLSFKLSAAGYQNWLDQFQARGMNQESSPFFYLARFNGGSYQFRLGWTVPNWDPRPGVDPRPDAMVKDMEQQMEMAGIPVNLREALLGSPPAH